MRLNKKYNEIPMDCFVCQSISGKKRISPGPLICEGKYWLVDHAYPTKMLGWLVIVLKRHSQALHELTKEEFSELGQLQEKTIKILHKKLNCQKEYLSCFAESKHFNHLHVHIIPRSKDLRENLKGPKIFSMIKADGKNSLPAQAIIEFSYYLKNEF